MKTSFSVAASIAVLVAISAHASVLVGPISNPANGHDYYLISPNSWSAAEAEAEKMGGTLAIIKNAAEQQWIASTFVTNDGPARMLWIGLHKAGRQDFSWVADVASNYRNWGLGQPDNNGGVEYAVHLERNGKWNDNTDGASVKDNPIYGVVEIPGKSNRKTLTKEEKALIGEWYASGRNDHSCWIVGTQNKLFHIYDHWSSPVTLTPEGNLFAANPINGIFGEVVKDRILWSNGTWWSRTAIDQKPKD